MLKDVLVNIRDLARGQSIFEPDIDKSIDKRLRRMIARGHEEIWPIVTNLRKENIGKADELDLAIIGDYLIKTAAVSKVDKSHLDDFTKKRFKKQVEDMTEEKVYRHLEIFSRSISFNVPTAVEEQSKYLEAAQTIAQTAFILSKMGFPPSNYTHHPEISRSVLLMNSIRS